MMINVKNTIPKKLYYLAHKYSTKHFKQYRVVEKKVLHKSEEKMHKKMKLTKQRAENVVHVQQHHSVSFYKKIFFLFRFI